MKNILAVLVFEFVILPINAQLIKRAYSPREIVVQKGDSLIRTFIITENTSKSPVLNKKYYWYSNGIVNSNFGGYAGKLLHDDYQLFINNRLIESGSYQAGLKVGKWITWYETGLIRNILYYKDGVLHGEYFNFSKDGQIESNGKYVNGEIHLRKDKEKNKSENLNSESERQKRKDIKSDKKVKNTESKQPVIKHET